MFWKIRKIQSDVDELLDLCDQTGQQDEHLSAEDKKHIRLGEMILKVQDGELPKRNLMRMEKWLMCDDQALRYYVEFQNLCALLHGHFNKSWSEKIRNAIKEHMAVNTV